MKFSTLTLAIFALTESSVLAFPAGFEEALLKKSGISPDGCPHLLLERERERNKKRALGIFDPVAQKVDVSGTHKWVAPKRTDQRGPCPGLNALANHGYLPHNGVADIATLISATNKVYGMALDLGAFLAVYGTLINGNPVSLTPGYSIGGPAASTDPIAGRIGLLAQPQGLSGSHNKYEADTSPTRGDLYLYGNDYVLQLPQFAQYYAALPDNVNSDTQFRALADFHAARHQDSVSRNPYFFFPPFAGILVSPAGYAFPPRMMANHSAEYPDGYLDKTTFKSFFAVSGTPGKFTYKHGYERIPDNWYRRPIGDDYSIPAFNLDVLDHGLKHPELLIPGGNTGKKNSFTPLNLTAFTSGVYNSANLLQGNNLQCFIFQALQGEMPDVLDNVIPNVASVIAPFSKTLSGIINGLSCPALSSVDNSQFNIYPGYKKSQGGV